MKKMTSLIDKLAGYQIDISEAKNIKGGNSDLDFNSAQGFDYGGGDPPPF